jgi:ribosome maturation factor RimP
VRPDAQLEKLRPVAQRVVGSYGFDLFELQLRRESIGWVLRIVIDYPTRFGEDGSVLVDPVERSIGIDDCQRVSQDLSAVLDVEDVVEGHYTLEVSSPGIDRPLREANDYRRFVGRLAKVVVREALDGQKHFEGRIRDVDEQVVVLESGRRGRIARIPLDRISRAKLAVEF